MANRIKELRKARDLTLEQVAERAGTTFQQVQRLENSERRLTDDWMRRIALALDVPPAALFMDPTPDADGVSKNPEHRLLIEWWDSISDAERRAFAVVIRDKGLEALVREGAPRRSTRPRKRA